MIVNAVLSPFPTRRSSDLLGPQRSVLAVATEPGGQLDHGRQRGVVFLRVVEAAGATPGRSATGGIQPDTLGVGGIVALGAAQVHAGGGEGAQIQIGRADV